MNKVIIIGRLTKEPEIRTTQSQIPVASFTLAVDRRFKTSDGEKQADFIPVIAWRKLAELSGQYLKKGSKVSIVGNIQTRNYEDKDGKKVYATEVVAEELYFLDTKKADQGNNTSEYSPKSPSTTQHDYLTVDDDDTSLPFDL